MNRLLTIYFLILAKKVIRILERKQIKYISYAQWVVE